MITTEATSLPNPCIRCRFNPQTVYSSGNIFKYCKQCKAEKEAEYYKQNRDKKILRARKYYQDNITTCRTKAKERNDLPENKEKRKEYVKQYNVENSAKHVEQVQKWRQENPEKFKANRTAYVINRRARLQQAAGCFDWNSWIAKCMFHGWKCFYCEKELNEMTATIDHRKPLSLGGSNWTSNLAPACKSCNSRKSNRTEMEFRQIMQNAIKVV